MPKNKTIFFDCDHVLLDTQKAFADHIRNNLHHNISSYEEKYKYINDWKFFSGNMSKVFKTLEAWQRTESFEQIPSLFGAKTAIQKFKKAGYDLIIVSSAGTQKIAKQRRIINLENIFGKVFDNLFMLDWDKNKNTVLKNYTPSFFVDDNLTNTLNALEIKFKPVLIQNSHNKHRIEFHKKDLKKVKIVSSWKEITDYILG